MRWFACCIIHLVLYGIIQYYTAQSAKIPIIQTHSHACGHGLRPWAKDDGGVGGNAVAELAAEAGDVDLLLARWRQELQRLDETPEHDEQHGNGDDDPGARPSPSAKWKEAEVVSCDLHLGRGHAVQEALGHELVGLIPVLGVVGDPPRVHKHLAQ